MSENVNEVSTTTMEVEPAQTTSSCKHLQKTPTGRRKSGRFWKEQKKRFSSIVKTRGVKQSFTQREIVRQSLQNNKQISNEIKASKQKEREEKKQRRRDNIKRRNENTLKSEVVQVITNTKKIKKMRKSQLRLIQKRNV